MRYVLFLFCVGLSMSGFAQRKLDKLLKEQNTESIPYISIDSLYEIQNRVILLDSRETKEFETSHLKNAICVGYDSFNLKKTVAKLPDKNANIVVYCSLGIRSEDVAEKLKNAGYKNVLNLYGGIFKWKNNDLEIVNSQQKATDTVHVFSEEWSKWLKKGVKKYD